MDMLTALEGHPVSYRQAAAEIESHGGRAAPSDPGHILAQYDGGDDWERLPLDSAAILEWLGY